VNTGFEEVRDCYLLDMVFRSRLDRLLRSLSKPSI